VGKKFVHWTTEQSDALKDAVGAGLSFREAAEAINQRFGSTHTRNAAIGKWYRLGTPFPKRAPREKKPRMYKPRQIGERPRIIRTNGNSNAMRVISVEVVEQMRLRCVEIIPLNLTLAEISDDQCRYIAGDDHLYCGHPKMSGSSYCTPHHHLVWEKPRAPKEKYFRRVA
jgi:GcrA cell cycle regulator